MAEYVELLVKAVDATHPDKVKDIRGCWKRGDVVDIRPAGFKWGSEEGPPKFQIVTMLKSEADKLDLLESETEEKIIDAGKEEQRVELETLRRRKLKVNLDALVPVKGEKVELKAGKVSTLVITKPSAKTELESIKVVK